MAESLKLTVRLPNKPDAFIYSEICDDRGRILGFSKVSIEAGKGFDVPTLVLHLPLFMHDVEITRPGET